MTKHLLITSLLLYGATALLCLVFSVLRPTRTTARLTNLLGSLGAALGSAVGLLALFLSPVAEEYLITAPFGLPVGAFILILDPLSRLFLLPVFGLGLLCAVSGGFSLRHEAPRRHNLGAHWLFYALLLSGLTLVMTARDMVLFLLSWELMSLAPFFLIDFNDGDSKVRDASWVYLTAAHLGAVALMAFFALIWHVSGSTTLSSDVLAPAFAACSPKLGVLILLLGLAGFGAKAGLAPMHIWLPEAHPAAPSHVSALLSGAMINAGLYGIARTTVLLTPTSPPEWWGWLLLLAGLSTALMGILRALAQRNVKRLLAYSSVENMGLLTMALGAGLLGHTLANGWIALMGCAAFLVHMLNHAVFKGLLFLTAGEILHRTGTVNMEQLGGLVKTLPVTALCFGVGAASIAGLPPFNGFAGEFLLMLSLLDGPTLAGAERQMILLLSLAGLAAISGLAAQLYAKASGIVFLGHPRTGFAQNVHPEEKISLIPLLALAALCLLLGLFATPVFSVVTQAAVAAFQLGDLAAATKATFLSGSRALTITGLLSAALMVLAILFFLLRKKHLQEVGEEQGETWACGYQGTSSRIQYTAASFSEPTARVLGQLMGQKVSLTQDSHIFPVESTLSVQAPDRLRRHFYTPLFSGIESLCNALKIVQHGKIHLYILYILVTLIVLLIWGLHA